MQNTKINEVYSQNPIVNSNDYKKTIINVDSSYRNSQTELSTNFYYDLPMTLRNVIKVRLASFEIPNVWYEFCSAQYNTFFSITAPDITGKQQTMLVTIPDGNYTASQIVNVIQESLNTYKVKYGIYILISIDPYTLRCTLSFQGTITPPGASGSVPPNPTNPPSGSFFIDFRTPSTELTNWGLGYNLGYRQQYYTVTSQQNGLYLQQSEGIIDPITTAYIFLIINEFYCVLQKTDENYFDATAKIIVRQDKGQVIYDDGSDLVSNEITLPSPIDLTVLKVQLVDFRGNIINLNSMNFSFTLEIIQVQNSKLNEHYRNYIWDGQDPKVSRNARGSAVAGFQALPGNRS